LNPSLQGCTGRRPWSVHRGIDKGDAALGPFPLSHANHSGLAGPSPSVAGSYDARALIGARMRKNNSGVSSGVSRFIIKVLELGPDGRGRERRATSASGLSLEFDGFRAARHSRCSCVGRMRVRGNDLVHTLRSRPRWHLEPPPCTALFNRDAYVANDFGYVKIAHRASYDLGGYRVCRQQDMASALSTLSPFLLPN
jgi:hypothetical protein